MSDLPLIHYHNGSNLAVQCKIEADRYDTTIYTKPSSEAQWSGLNLTPQLASAMVSALQEYLQYVENNP